MMKSELWKKVKELEKSSNEIVDEYYSVKKFLLDNYGQDQNRHQKLVDSDMSLYQMVTHLTIWMEGRTIDGKV